MATVSQLNHFPFKYLPLTQPRNQTRTSVPVNPSGFGLSLIEGPKLSARELNWMRPVFRLRCTIEDGCSPENGEPASSGTDGPAVVVAEYPLEEKTEKPEDSAEIEKLKKALVDSLYGTDRGLRATSEMQAQIVELITQLEASNPTPAPTDALSLLNGKWILVYTSFSGLFPLLSKGSLPFVKVEEISQTIDSENFTVQNSVQFAGPLATTSVSTSAKFEVRSPKRVQIKFVEGVIGTPQLIDSLEIPENVNFLGQKIDLTPFKGLITSIQDTASSVAKAISCQPPLKFSILNNNAESWLLTTYLDEDLRISRVDAGSVFVLIKEGSLLLTP